MSSLPVPPTVLASSSSHLLIASGSSLQLYHTSASSSPTSTSSPFKSLITHAALSPSSTHAVAAYEDKSLCTFSLSEGTPRLLHTRQTVKRVSALSFADDNSIIVSDKVGDVFLYPLEPRVSEEAAKDRPQGFVLIADPTLNPDADLLAGHVSVVTAHLLAPGGKRLITADRDEHIRISRYPRADVIEKYLFGTDGFVSAVHIPVSKPELLLSAGGERWLRIWDWAKGTVTGRVDIMEAILPHRRVRSAMRRLKRAPKRARVDEGTGVGETAESSFYEAPEGWLLPSGQGVCIKKIDSVQVGAQTVVLFFSEG
jgi:tRNA (guanine-N(7)-)-methyltransferase subunit TRM82